MQGERNEPKCFQNSVCPRAFRPLTPALPFQLPDAADTRQIFVKLGEKEPYLVIFHLSYLPSHCPQGCPQSNQSALFPNTAQEPLRTLDPGFSVSGPQFTQLKIGDGSLALSFTPSCPRIKVTAQDPPPSGEGGLSQPEGGGLREDRG